MNKAVFLDKDGTLIPDIPYNIDPDLIKLSDDCTAGLNELQQEGFLLLVVSNQSGIARGYFKEEALGGVRRKLEGLLNKENIRLDDFFYCPHHPDGKVAEYNVECSCRKPLPGMLQQAAQKYQIDLSQSWMIGDILNDVEAGNRAGCKTVLIDNGNETEWLINELRKPDYIVKSINEAAIQILKPVKTIPGNECSLS
ncbi:D-glycero-alpha-D-manno-heptose-1,7-bisphosphate 7-phosphatase [Rubrolithibacter danxiaensis]|uniref:D-glycero-alpha-D-manno-heptose-1,7-bisphosphate 7-phosphatase n=1 Tax=Rubrolithibacter danxiaensis TaxID=3390805 RepID=UPI003BF8BA37